jgi:hypothetical protein
MMLADFDQSLKINTKICRTTAEDAAVNHKNRELTKL